MHKICDTKNHLTIYICKKTHKRKGINDFLMVVPPAHHVQHHLRRPPHQGGDPRPRHGGAVPRSGERCLHTGEASCNHQGGRSALLLHHVGQLPFQGNVKRPRTCRKLRTQIHRRSPKHASPRRRRTPRRRGGAKQRCKKIRR